MADDAQAADVGVARLPEHLAVGWKDLDQPAEQPLEADSP